MLLNKKIVALTLMSLFSTGSIAGNSLSDICSQDGGKIISNVHIQNYTAVTVWPQIGGQDKHQPSVQIKVNNVWYGILSQDLVHGGGAYGIQSYAQTMALLHESVDICVKNGVFRGLQKSKDWPK